MNLPPYARDLADLAPWLERLGPVIDGLMDPACETPQYLIATRAPDLWRWIVGLDTAAIKGLDERLEAALRAAPNQKPRGQR